MRKHEMPASLDQKQGCRAVGCLMDNLKRGGNLFYLTVSNEISPVGQKKHFHESFTKPNEYVT